ncbi:MAG: nucleotidyltransferase family protein [Tetrasphaera sp.]|nr:nucleotidyltransferase family protein [Tetrasphaera sp.]
MIVDVSTVVGVVLAAGQGRRMGRPKALVPHPATGRTLVEETVCRVATAGVRRLIVVTGAAGPEVEAMLLSGAWAVGARLRRRVEVLLVECPDFAEGIGASLRTGLKALADLTDPPAASSGDAALVTLIDLPDVGAEVYRRLLRSARAQAPVRRRAGLARAAYQGVPGHPVVLGREHWAGIAASAAGDQGARDYLRTHLARLIECGDLATGRDVDAPGDWQRLEGGG